MPIMTACRNRKTSISCLALIKTRSELEKRWNLHKPAYCIYEYDAAFGEHTIRWGDGSWEVLSAEDFDDVVLLEQFDESTWSEILRN